MKNQCLHGFEKGASLTNQDGRYTLMGNGHGSRMTDGALMGGGNPGDDGDDLLAFFLGRGQRTRVEWGPYLGYGGGSGV